MSTRLDPFSLEILGNGVRSITDEAFVALMKSAYSTNIKERRDHSTAIMSPEGALIAQANDSLPLHIASMTGLMEKILGRHRESLAPGDIFVANDPYEAGGTHLPDINLAMPVFAAGELLGFVCNIAHHADVGGMAPGSMAGGMTEIFQEGLRIPVVRLFRAGELVQDVFDLLLLNVRVPAERRGDYFAQIAACRLGARRLEELAGTWGTDTLLAAFPELVERSRTRMRAGIREIPDGVWTFEDCLDGDGTGHHDLPIRVRIEVRGEEIALDFEGTSPQVPGNLNTTLNATLASVCYALKALLDPEIPNSQGVLDAPRLTVPEGTLLNARFPAPVAARANTCQRVVDVVLGALAPALPERAIGAANGANTTAVFSGTDPRTGGPYVYLETLGGGMGARRGLDGKDGVQVHMTNTSNLPVEAIEQEYPLLVESYGLVPDSGGEGRWRGGLGLRRVIRPRGHTTTFNGVGERFRHAPWGVFGGLSGRPGRFVLERLRGPEGKEGTDGPPGEAPTGSTSERLPDKSGDLPIGPEARIIVETPGAGGYGPPAERTLEAIAADLASGKVSPGHARRIHGEERVRRALALGARPRPGGGTREPGEER